MDLLDNDMRIWLLIFYYTLSELLRNDIECLMIFLLIGYNSKECLRPYLECRAPGRLAQTFQLNEPAAQGWRHSP